MFFKKLVLFMIYMSFAEIRPCFCRYANIARGYRAGDIQIIVEDICSLEDEEYLGYWFYILGSSTIRSFTRV